MQAKKKSKRFDKLRNSKRGDAKKEEFLRYSPLCLLSKNPGKNESYKYSYLMTVSIFINDTVLLTNLRCYMLLLENISWKVINRRFLVSISYKICERIKNSYSSFMNHYSNYYFLIKFSALLHLII